MAEALGVAGTCKFGRSRFTARHCVRIAGVFAILIAMVAVPSLLLSAPKAVALSCSTTWNGTSGGWTNAANWSGGVPTASSDACLPAGSYTVTALGNVIPQIHSLTIGSGATLSLGNDAGNNPIGLYATSGITNAGTILLGGSCACASWINNGSVPLLNTGIIDVEQATWILTGASTIDNQGTLTVNNDLTLQESLANSGTLTIASGKTLAVNGVNFDLNGGTLTNNGNFHQSGGTFTHNGGVASGNPLHLSSVSIAPDPSSGSAVFVLDGNNTLISDVAATDTLVVTHDSYNNSGTLSMGTSYTNAGTIQMGAPPSISGTLGVGPGATLTNTGTLATVGDAGTQTIAGNLDNQGTFTINTSTLLDPTLYGTQVTSTGTLTIASGKTLAVNGGIFNLNGGTLTNNGTFHQSGGTFNHNAGTVGGNYLLLSGVSIAPDPSSGSAGFVLDGNNTLISDVAATDTLVVTHDSYNNSGSLSMSASYTNAGTIQMGAPPSISGTLAVGTGATLTNTGTLATVGDGGTQTIAGNVDNQGTFSVNTTTAVDPGLIDDYGTITVAAGIYLTNIDDTLIVEPGGTFTLAPTGHYAQQSGATLEVTVDAVHNTYTGISGGDTNLAGNLQVTTLGLPALNSTWPIISGASRSGTFGSHDFGTTGYDILYPSTGVTLQVNSSPSPSISIANLPGSAAVGGSFTPTYTYPGDGVTSTTSSTPSICSVTGGQVHYLAVGTCTLVAHATATTNWAAATGANQSFAIGQGTAHCSNGLTPHVLVAATSAGPITGLFCVNAQGIGTYTQDGRIAPAQIIKVGNILWFQADGNNLRNSGYLNTANGASSFVQTKPIPATGKVTSLT